MKNIKTIILWLSVLSVSACSSLPDAVEKVSNNNNVAEQADYVISDVSILDIKNDGALLKNKDVYIRNKKILKVVSAKNSMPPTAETIIDGRGRYLIPGLAELHAHIPVPRDGDASLTHETMLLFVAHGITTIRGMKGAPYHLQLRDLIAQGKLIGPRIFTSGERLNNNTVKSVEQAKKVVQRQYDAGYDFVKIHRRLSPALFHAIAEQADTLGMRIAGHIPEEVGLKEALSRKYLSVEHFDGYMEALVPDAINVEPYKNGGLFALPLAEFADEKKIESLVELTRNSGAWMVPTAAWLERIVLPVDPQEYFQEDGMKYISPKQREGWRNWKRNIDKNTRPELAKKYIDTRRKLLKAMHDGGVGMLFGADAPQFANVPGFSMHHEVKAYQAAGLSNLDILKMATLNPARFFKQMDVFGDVAEGLEADLVLLEANPLDDMDNLRNPAGVMLRGRWLSRKNIERMLEAIANKYNK